MIEFLQVSKGKVMPEAVEDMVKSVFLVSQGSAAALAGDLVVQSGASESEGSDVTKLESSPAEEAGCIACTKDALQVVTGCAKVQGVDVHVCTNEDAGSVTGEVSCFNSGNDEPCCSSSVYPGSSETEAGSSTARACVSRGSSWQGKQGPKTQETQSNCSLGEPWRQETAAEEKGKDPELTQTSEVSLSASSCAASSRGNGGSSVASSSRAPLQVSEIGHLPTGSVAICGRRREMEDTFSVVHNFLSLPCELVGGCTGVCLASGHTSGGHEDTSPLHFFGVYDGHGGAQVANFCRDHLHQALEEEIQTAIGADEPGPTSRSVTDSWKKQWEKVMTACFLRVDAEIEGVYMKGEQCGREGNSELCAEPIAAETVGTTAVVAVVGSCQIIVANCGDSRAVLSRGGKAVALSVDHKPEREDEMIRIEAAGGKVICWNGYRVFGVLAMSRAIGDRYLKPFVIADPEVTCTQRSEDDDCLILATDGLWDVLSNDEVCEVARRRLAGRGNSSATAGSSASASRTSDENAEAAATLLTKMALAQGSNDNISVVVVDLRNRNKP